MLDRPKPSGGGWVELVRFLSDPLTYLPRIAREHGGDLVPFWLGNLPCTLVTGPEYIKAGLMNESWPPISRGRLVNIKNWFTGGLFVNEGAEHHRQRDELWLPILEDPNIPRLTSEVAEDWVGAWQEGRSYDLFHELRDMDYAIDWKAMTGEDIRTNRPLLDALEVGAETLPWLILPLGVTRWKLPLPATLRAKRSKAMIDDHLAKLIAERRSDPSIQDLLGRLVAIRDKPESKSDDEELRSTVKMYFGADQLHALFAWTFHLVSQNPEVEAKLHEELDRELSGPPTVDDVEKLTYTRNVLKESMRVMAPVWVFFRELTADFQLGDTVLPKGSLMAFSPWVTHRDERYWPDPLKFDPDRWLPDADRPPAISYFPFSAGPYWCHGGHLAMVQALLITATIARHWRLRPASSKPPKAIATWCTEPKGGLHMKVTRRS